MDLRIAKSNNCDLDKIIKPKEVFRVQTQKYKIIIRPTLTQACETWTILNKIKRETGNLGKKNLKKNLCT